MFIYWKLVSNLHGQKCVDVVGTCCSSSVVTKVVAGGVSSVPSVLDTCNNDHIELYNDIIIFSRVSELPVIILLLHGRVFSVPKQQVGPPPWDRKRERGLVISPYTVRRIPIGLFAKKWNSRWSLECYNNPDTDWLCFVIITVTDVKYSILVESTRSFVVWHCFYTMCVFFGGY